MCLMLCCLSALNSYAQLGTPPRILVQPLGLSVTEGGTAVFSATVFSLTNPSFKWYRGSKHVGNGTTVAGVNTLIVDKVKASDAGEYFVEVRNAAGTVISSNAPLLVLTETVSDVVEIISSGMTTNGFNLRLSVPTGSNVVISATSDLSTWTPISTNTAANGTVNFTDTAARNYTARFYKVAVQ
jgi:hypothetical protein